jgi:hypothetical protein
MKKYLIITLLLSCLSVKAQDVSGATIGSISTTSHIHKGKRIIQDVVEKPNKILYIFEEDTKLNNTFILYKSKEYQVYKTKNNQFYFNYNKKRVYFKKR